MLLLFSSAALARGRAAAPGTPGPEAGFSVILPGTGIPGLDEPIPLRGSVDARKIVGTEVAS